MSEGSKSFSWGSFAIGVIFLALVIGPQATIEKAVSGWVATYYNVTASFAPPVELIDPEYYAMIDKQSKKR